MKRKPRHQRRIAGNSDRLLLAAVLAGMLVDDGWIAASFEHPGVERTGLVAVGQRFLHALATAVVLLAVQLALEHIFYYEFDTRRKKRVLVKIVGE